MFLNIFTKFFTLFKTKKKTALKSDFSVKFDSREEKWFENKLNILDFPDVYQWSVISYNQNLNKYSRYWCFLYSFFTIISNIYWIKFDNDFLIRKLKKSEKEKIYRVWSWARFTASYKWLTQQLSKNVWIKLVSYSTMVDSKNFTELLDKWYFFAIWSKKANKEYFEEIKDWDIDNLNFNSWNKNGHLQTYYKDLKTWKYFIIENYNWFLNDNTIEFSLDKLKYAYKKWMYYRTARTIIPVWNKKNTDFFKYLQDKKKSKI